ncbi:MAG: dTMP kinase [Proteobacteria bacterium]|nr:MAG: dTMP kinase [Pseudomonadota bacterium]PIE19318.1 MAG: dTMP kinase [Pseudomonadota bacterium]
MSPERTRGRGLFIALEGIDGSGTTTQARRLTAALDTRGERAHFTFEPTDQPIGRLLRQVLRGEHQCASATIALLFAADRLEHVRGEVEPYCSAGTHVIADRYVHSSLAYQSLDLPLSWVSQLNTHAPAADLTIYLRVSPEVAAERRRIRGEPDDLFDALESQRRIAAAYDQLLGRAPGQIERRGRGELHHRVAVVDGDRDQETIAANLSELLDAELSRHQGSE